MGVQLRPAGRGSLLHCDSKSRILAQIGVPAFYKRPIANDDTVEQEAEEALEQRWRRTLRVSFHAPGFHALSKRRVNVRGLAVRAQQTSQEANEALVCSDTGTRRQQNQGDVVQ